MKNMLVCNSNSYNNFSIHPAFSGRKIPIDLNYILEKRHQFLPKRILQEVQKETTTHPESMRSLKELHKDTYSKLLGCKTLEDVKKLFPEFSSLLEANTAFKKNRGSVKTLSEGGFLKQGFTLKLLQDIWANLKNLDDIAKEIGLESRKNLEYILEKIGITPCNGNYKQLIAASDPVTREIMAAKTKSWNAAHPQEVKIRNKKAAQGTKSEKYRREKSASMKALFEREPERKEKISEYNKIRWADPKNREQQSIAGKAHYSAHPERAEKSSNLYKSVWQQIPEKRALMSAFFEEYTANNKILGARLKHAFSKKHKDLTIYDKTILKAYMNAFYEAHPEIKEKWKQAWKIVREKGLK